MLSAWDIYWVMQLDSINGTFCFLAVMSGIGLGMWLFALAVTEGELLDANSGKFIGKLLTCVFLVTALISTFLPSTKTAAVMVVLPAVVNNENVQREAGELYNIAKSALRELAKPDVKPDAEQKE